MRHDADDRRAAEITYENYCQDSQNYQSQGCSYTEYITKLIDELVGTSDFHENDTLAASISPLNKEAPASSELIIHQIPEQVIDFNDKTKTVGYLALQDTKFSFTGPDRPPVEFHSIEQYLHIADVILNTGLANYKAARYPIQSELNIPAWEKYLQNYPHERVLQYLKFGFPLSIRDSHELHNVEIKNHKNHYSAVQYPDQVQNYLDTEYEHGALLGPVPAVKHTQYHCSPLMSRPKQGNKCCIILDPSYPSRC